MKYFCYICNVIKNNNMRNLITILLFILTFFQSYGKDIWSCADFDADVKTYSEIANQWKSSGNKKWAKKLLEAFPISSDNTIKYQYVVNSDSTFNINDIGTSLLSWYKTKMTGVNPCPSGCLTHLSGIAILQGMGNAIGYMNATFINAREEVTIDVKENRVRITVVILSYIGANAWKGTENVAPGACYPVNPSAGQKDSHAMAFINCHSDALNTISSIIKYLNENSRTIMNGDDEW